jgi:hypothetical protein
MRQVRDRATPPPGGWRRLTAAVLFTAVSALPAAGQDTLSIPAGGDSLLAPFFKDRSPLAITLETDIRELSRDRTGEPEWQPATVRFADGDSLTARVRTRGLFRRRRCALPPLKLDIPQNKAKATAFAGLNKPKLVTHCGSTERHEQYVVQEYLLYRVYELLTPISHRARLVRVTYVDPRERGDSSSRYAIVLEEDEDVAARTGLRVVEITGAGPADLDSYQSALVGVFQYLIGNTDWSATGLHNVVLLQSMLTTYPVAYDFDFSGAVEATYATPDPRLGIRSVRERLYRGFCTTEDRWAEVFAHIRSQKEAIWALYREESALDAGIRDRTLAYFDQVFRVLDDPAAANREIVRKCRG